jgi:hypothetical protein
VTRWGILTVLAFIVAVVLATWVLQYVPTGTP